MLVQLIVCLLAGKERSANIGRTLCNFFVSIGIKINFFSLMEERFS